MTARIRLYFFFYGTLVAGSGNTAAQAAHARLRPVGPATASGALWAIPDGVGWYPALVAGLGGLVHGMLYGAADGFDADDLARLDSWEDYRPDNPDESLYLRKATQVTDAGGNSITAQVYRFNQSMPDGALAIVGGDFHAWLAATGRTAYSG